MSNIDGKFIDMCSEYITGKDCHYLAKEGQIVYFASTTGRKSDFIWHKLTPTEFMRIIKAMHMSFADAAFLKEGHLIAAFQELGRVYEYGVKSRHLVKEGIFNYSTHSDSSLDDQIAIQMIASLERQGYVGLHLSDMVDLYDSVAKALDIPVTSRVLMDLFRKHWEAAGWEVRTGSLRVLIGGRKVPVIIKQGYKPADVCFVNNPKVRNFIFKEVMRELK
tara:strand:+ start:497 stop:1156 length:660 start_codon:yes stop_codon:yes gene_type:complete